MSVIIETTLGDITIDLFLKERPRTCLNFLKLCKVKYYNFCLFHSVQRNFVAQTGDPTGAGRGGESIFQTLYGDQAKYFDAEVVPKIKHREIGTVSMVNDGNGQHGSQFLITLGESLDYLDGVHSVFGQVAEGMDVLMKINETFCDKENRPFRDIRITHTVILDDPLDDPPGLQIPDRSPEPTAEQLKSLLRIGADEELDDTKGLTEHEVVEKEETVEAEHRAQVLAIIGDLPDKDVKPPDNVLFVCKLNPVTTDEDLEIIFTRFGTIVSCEIIRDFKSGESLQYAFIEFSNPEECEKAYLKMDNVLIDDRRIHVDFSQSVSRMDYRRSNNPKLRNDEPKGDGHAVAKGKDRKEQSDSRSNRTKPNRRRDDDRSRRRSQEKRSRHSSSRSRDDSSRGRAPTSNYRRRDRDFERSASPNRTRERRIDRRDDSRSEHSEKTRLRHAGRRRDSSDSDKSSEGKSRGKRNREKIAGDRKGRHESERRSSNSKIEKKQSRRERSKTASSSSEDSSSSSDESLSAKKRSRSKVKKARSPSTDSECFEKRSSKSRAKQSGNKSRKRCSRSSSAGMKYKSKSSSKRKNRERSSSSSDSDSERERRSRLSKKKKR